MIENNNIPHFWHVIINPNALRGRSLKYWKKVSQSLIISGFKFTEIHTNSKKDATRIASELVLQGNKNILIVGGDGTLNEVINGIVLSKIDISEIIIGVIPAGTGNDWSRTHLISRNPNKIVEMFLNGRIINHDIGKIKVVNDNVTIEHFFINIAGLGFDAAVIKRVHEALKYKVASGLVYVKHLLFTLFKYKSVICEIEIDNTKFEKDVFSIAVGICKYNGNGMLQVPMANPSDGILDVVIIEKMSKLTAISQIPNLFSGKHIYHHRVSCYSAKKVIINPKYKLYAETEGEMIGEGSFEIEVLENKIQVLVP